MGIGVAAVSLKGNLSSLKTFTAGLRNLPRVVAQKVATASAPVLTDQARATFEAGENPYGDTWKPGANGQRVTLVKSGSLLRNIRYVAIGTKIRVALGVAYAKFQIGRRPVFPAQGSPLPTSYVSALTDASNDAIRAELGAT